MIIRIPGYNYGAKIVSLALSDDVLQTLKAQNLDYIYVFDHILNFKTGENIHIPDNVYEKFMSCADYDIFQIASNGNAYKCFDSTSEDNGLMLTALCNSNCIMCPASDTQRKQTNGTTIDEFIEIIHHMPSDTEHITITGGEPFLVGEDIFRILKALKEHLPCAKYLLLTNGRAFAYYPYMKQFSKCSPEKIIIGIPLHGYDAATHDSITRSKGGFEQTVLGINNLLREGNSVELRIVVSKLNANFLDKIAAFITQNFKGILRVEIMGLEMLGNAAVNKEKVWLPYKEAFKYAKPAVDILVRNAFPVGLYNFPLCAVEKEYRLIAVKSISDYKVKFPVKCNNCKIKDACGGIFQGSILFADKDVEPVV